MAAPSATEVARRLKLSSKKLGSGGFASVQSGTLDNEIVAVKLLLPHHCRGGPKSFATKRVIRIPRQPGPHSAGEEVFADVQVSFPGAREALGPAGPIKAVQATL